MSDPFGPNLEQFTEPPEEDFSYLPPKEKDNSSEEDGDILSNLKTASLRDPTVRSELESLMLANLIEILKDRKAPKGHKLSAIKEVKDMLGLSKAAPTPISGENVQVNQTVLDTDQAKHLLENLQSAKAVGRGTDSGTRPIEGGKGV